MKHSNIKAYSHMGGVVRNLILTLALVITLSVTSFADITVGKEWNDGLTGTSANNRVLPTVSLSGETSYEKLLNLMYPVGSCYISLDENFDPNTAWGGTWELLPEAQTVIQAGDTYTFGSTGGETRHVLTVSEMPSHGGHGNSWAGNYAAFVNTNVATAYGSGGRGWSKQAGNELIPTYENAGGNQPHNNMPPYVAGNIWKRTA